MSAADPSILSFIDNAIETAVKLEELEPLSDIPQPATRRAVLHWVYSFTELLGITQRFKTSDAFVDEREIHARLRADDLATLNAALIWKCLVRKQKVAVTRMAKQEKFSVTDGHVNATKKRASKDSTEHSEPAAKKLCTGTISAWKRIILIQGIIETSNSFRERFQALKDGTVSWTEPLKEVLALEKPIDFTNVDSYDPVYERAIHALVVCMRNHALGEIDWFLNEDLYWTDTVLKWEMTTDDRHTLFFQGGHDVNNCPWWIKLIHDGQDPKDSTDDPLERPTFQFCVSQKALNLDPDIQPYVDAVNQELLNARRSDTPPLSYKHRTVSKAMDALLVRVLHNISLSAVVSSLREAEERERYAVTIGFDTLGSRFTRDTTRFEEFDFKNIDDELSVAEWFVDDGDDE